MDRFAKMHPAFHFVFFICVFALSVSVLNPVFCTASLVGALLYIGITRGSEVLSCLKFVLTIIAVVSIFNMLFAGYGVTELFSIGNKRFTLEALIYGFNQGLMLGGTVLWFDIFSHIMDSQRVVYLLRFAPKSALIFSMVLGFIPRFKRKAQDIRQARIGLNGGSDDKGIKERVRNSLNDFSALVGYSVEAGIITSDSMASRGYNPAAVQPNRYRMKMADALLLAACLVSTAYVLYSKMSRKILFVFEPRIYFESFDFVALVLFCTLCLIPVIIDFAEVMRWKISASRM